jgi:hypothetical protein
VLLRARSATTADALQRDGGAQALPNTTLTLAEVVHAGAFKPEKAVFTEISRSEKPSVRSTSPPSVGVRGDREADEPEISEDSVSRCGCRLEGWNGKFPGGTATARVVRPDLVSRPSAQALVRGLRDGE